MATPNNDISSQRSTRSNASKPWESQTTTFRVGAPGDNTGQPPSPIRPPPKSRAHFNREPCSNCAASKVKCEYESIPGPLRICKRCMQHGQPCEPKPKKTKAPKQRKRNHRRCHSANATCGAAREPILYEASFGDNVNPPQSLPFIAQAPATAPPTPASAAFIVPLPNMGARQAINVTIDNDDFGMFDTNPPIYHPLNSQLSIPMPTQQSQTVAPLGYSHCPPHGLTIDLGQGSGTEPFGQLQYYDCYEFPGL